MTKIALTDREKECLQHISKGKTFKETATAMKISPRTVETYITSMKSKIGVYGKSALIEYFWREHAKAHSTVNFL